MIHRDVVIDLIPVYLSGEASEETRKLVEQAVKSDPELAKNLDRERELLSLGAPPALPPDHEKRTLDRTKTAVRRRSVTFAGALLFLVPAVHVLVGERPRRGSSLVARCTARLCGALDRCGGLVDRARRDPSAAASKRDLRRSASPSTTSEGARRKRLDESS